MNNIMSILSITCFILIVFCIIFNTIRYAVKYFSELIYTKRQLRHSYAWCDYIYWKRRLRILYWCIIPGLTPERVKHIHYQLKEWKKAKIEKKKNKVKEDDGLFAMILPSLVGMLFCSICLMSSTYAWFHASQNVPVSNIQTGSWKVITTVTSEPIPNSTINANPTPINTEIDSPTLIPINGKYNLNPGYLYTITLEASGTISTGYCIIYLQKVSDNTDTNDTLQTYHTQQLIPSEESHNTMTFQLVIYEKSTMEIVPQWGTSSWNENGKITVNANQTTAIPYGDKSLYLATLEEEKESIADNIKEESTIQSSATQAPTTQAPTTQAPTTQAPTTQAPTTETSTEESTATESSTEESTATESSTEESTSTESSTEESTSTESSTEESTATESSTEKSTATESSTGESTSTETSTSSEGESETKMSHTSEEISSESESESEESYSESESEYAESECSIAEENLSE